MKNLTVFINESKELEQVNSVFKNKMSGSSGVLCPIHIFKQKLEKNEPILCGNWNPNEFVNKFNFDKFCEWVDKEWPAALQDCHEDELWVMEGMTYEDPELQKNTINVYEVIKLLEKKFGKPVGGGGVKNPCFGKLGLGSKYIYDYYFGKGECGILLRGKKDKPGERIITWALFMSASDFENLGFSVK